MFEPMLNKTLALLSTPTIAAEFVVNELSFANKSSLLVRNFAKSSGVKLKTEMPLLELDSPNILFSTLMADLGTYQNTISLRLELIDAVMKHYGLGKYANFGDKELIKQFCSERRITTLIHFTKVKNIKSILDIGLNSKDYNNEISKSYMYNDANRFDYRTHMISLSVSYPNDKMFYKYRQAQPEESWAVLEISVRVLWELDCLFCPTNAASSSITSATEESLSGSLALKQLFNNQPINLRACDPTDSQAEVLVNSHIPKEYIQSIYLDKPSELLANTDFQINNTYFHNRQYALSHCFN